MKLVVALLLSAIGVSVPCAAVTIAVTGPAQPPTPGTEFAVDVGVATGITDLYAFRFDVAFDPSVLSAMSVGGGSFLASGGSTTFDPGSINNVSGMITGIGETLDGAVPGVTGNGGPLAVVQFAALGGGTSGVKVENLTLLNSSHSDIGSGAVIFDDSITVAPEPASFWLMTCAAGFAWLWVWGKGLAARWLI